MSLLDWFGRLCETKENCTSDSIDQLFAALHQEGEEVRARYDYMQRKNAYYRGDLRFQGLASVPKQIDACEHDVPHRYACDICDAETDE